MESPAKRMRGSVTGGGSGRDVTSGRLIESRDRWIDRLSDRWIDRLSDWWNERDLGGRDLGGRTWSLDFLWLWWRGGLSIF